MSKYNYCILITFLLIVLHACDCKSPKHATNEPTIEKIQVNYGHNVIVLVDLSNRILNHRMLSDPDIVEVITSNLKTLFQNSIDKGINDKFYLTSINDQDLKNFPTLDSGFRIDLTRFQNDALLRSNYLYHNDSGRNSLKNDVFVLNSNFSKLYNNLQKGNQLPADIWYFFQGKLESPLIDTSSFEFVSNNIKYINKRKNYIILLTDGYIEAGRYKDEPSMKNKNKFRYLSQNLINEFRSEFKKDTSSEYTKFFKNSDYGIIPVNNSLLKNCKVLVLELYDRSRVNGVTTESPTDLEIMKLFWEDWLEKSQVEKSNITLKECFNNKESLEDELKLFLELR